MTVERFLDTNILVYAYDLNAELKREKAMAFLEQGWQQPGTVAISVQVLQEFHVNLIKRGLSISESAQIISDFSTWPMVENSYQLLQIAFKEQERWRISLWDGLILAAARAVKAREIISEDFSAGQDYGGIRIVNPFQ